MNEQDDKKVITIKDDHWLLQRDIEIHYPDDEDHVFIRGFCYTKNRQNPLLDGSVYFSKECLSQIITELQIMKNKLQYQEIGQDWDKINTGNA